MDDIKVTQWLDQEDRRVSQTIRTHGCSLEYVFPSERDDLPTPFCYTIGLFGLGHPELLVFGLDHSSAAGLLNHLHGLVARGRDLVPGELLAFDGHDETYLVEALPNPGQILFAANRHYRRPSEFSVPALQLTWSVGGAFPWDEGYPYALHSQPRPGDFSAVVDGSGDAGPYSG
jgi:hypothetical protein